MELEKCERNRQRAALHFQQPKGPNLILLMGVIGLLLLTKFKLPSILTFSWQLPQLVNLEFVIALSFIGLILSSLFQAGNSVTYSIISDSSKQQHIVINTPQK